eukprot:1104342-Prymnesium_polylepis.1
MMRSSAGLWLGTSRANRKDSPSENAGALVVEADAGGGEEEEEAVAAGARVGAVDGVVPAVSATDAKADGRYAAAMLFWLESILRVEPSRMMTASSTTSAT